MGSELKMAPRSVQFFSVQPECLDPCPSGPLIQPHAERVALGTRQLSMRVPLIRPDRNQRAETVNPIFLTAQAPLQSALLRVRAMAPPPAGDHPASREAELRVLLAFVLLGAVVAAATALLPTGLLPLRKRRVG